jgi:hypothetical protein
VQNPSCVGTDKSDVQSALSAAEATPDADRVAVGPGTFVDSEPYHYAGSVTNTVTLVGAGADATRLVSTKNGPHTTLTFGNGTVSDLEVVGPPSGAIQDLLVALDLGGLAERVKVTGGFGGVILRSGATVRHSVVSGSGLDYSRPAIRFAGTSGSLQDTTVQANTHGIGVVADSSGHFDVTRSSIKAGAAVAASNGAKLDIDDSLVTGPAGFTGLAAYAWGQSSTLTATNVTVAGPDPSVGEGVHAEALTAGKTATIVLQNSVVYGVKESLAREAPGGLAYVKADHSAYDPAAVTGSGAGNIWDAGGNTGAAPGFVDAPGGDFHLAPGSALIDAGSDAFAGGLPASDLSGAARSVDGNGDGTAVPDIGAYEFVPPPAPVPPGPSSEPVPSPAPVPSPDPGTPPAGDAAPKLSHVSLARRRFRAAKGSKLRYTLSKSARLTVRVKRVRAHGRLRSARVVRFNAAAGKRSRRLNTRGLKRGRYVALVVATGAGGHRSAQRKVSFRIVAPA